MTIFRGRPSYLVHLPPFGCLLHHLSFFGMWPYAIYMYVCPVYLSVGCLQNKLLGPSACGKEENDHLTCLFQISDETNVLQDGTLIDLCGATLLWRSHEGLEKSPVSWIYV
jgi:hypothetical protein